MDGRHHNGPVTGPGWVVGIGHRRARADRGGR